jgi:hypothetical protein
MFVVRLAALIALALWIGGMVAPIWMALGVPGDFGRQTRTLGYACGGVILVSLFVLKFVGPPPRHFTARATIAAVMVGVVAVAHAAKIASPVPIVVNVILSVVLLSWYVRE